MQKFLRTLTLLALLCVPMVMQGQIEVLLGDSTATSRNNSYLPANSLYNYSYTQQIYTAQEIGMEGTINSITLWLKGNADLHTLPITIYMVETNKAAFTSNTDWVTVTSSDIVYTGSLTVHNTGYQSYTFVLSNPFTYSGSGNLLIAVNNTCGQWKSGFNGMVFGETSDPVRSIYVRQDASAYDPYTPTFSAYGTSYERNVILFDITPAGGVSCNPVKNLTLLSDYSTGRTLTIKWKSNPDNDEDVSYNIYMASATDTSIIGSTTDTVYTIENLTPDTTYRFAVAANCGADGESVLRYVNGTTTVACPVPIRLTSVLNEDDATVATINWVDHNASAWEIRYWAVGQTDTSEIINANDTTYEFTGLTPETLYQAQVRANCGSDDGYSLWSNAVSFQPTNKTVIGTPETTSTYLPTECYYKYSLTQQLYTAEELGEAGTIMSVDFMCQGTTSRTLSVYMVSTTDSVLSSFVPVSGGDMVFSGPVNFTANNWTSIEFTTPFIYDGSSNVILVVDDNTGSWLSDISFRVYNATNQAISDADDYTNYDPTNTSSYTATAQSAKNCIRILKGELPDCMPATMLTVVESALYAHTADIRWMANGNGNFRIDYKKATDEEWQSATTSDSVFTLTELDPVTTYEVRVIAICEGETESLPSPVVSFTTKVACQKPTNLTVTPAAFEATVTWHDTIAEAWQLQLITINTDPTPNDTSEMIPVTDTIYTLTDLTPEHSYRVRVLADCNETNDSLSQWVSKSFTTLASCLVPDSLIVTLTPGNGQVASISWVDTNEVVGFELKLVQDTVVTYIDAEESPYDLSDLTPESAYSVSIRAICGEGDTSRWSSAISFTPTNFYNYTVADGTTTNSYVPVHGFDADNYLRCQTIYPAASLATLAGSDITGLTYYISSPAGAAWTGTFTVKMMEVTNTTLSAFNNAIDNEPVLYTGTLDATGNTMTITLSQPYTYAGGNLLIEVKETVKGNWKSVSFRGIEATSASWQGHNSTSVASITGSAQNFIPKTTFSFEPGVITDCARPDSLTVSDVDAHNATFTWQGEASDYLLQYKQADATNWTEVSNVSAPYTLTGLQQNTTYSARVKAICGSDTSMASFAVSFTTTISCPAPTNIQAILTPGDGTVARVTWTDTVGTAWQVCLVLDGDTSDIYDVTDTTAYDFTELTPEAIYTAMVRSICDEASDDISEWVHGTFNPTAKVVVGTPQTTDYYLPTNSNYNYSLTQQIYTAAELGNTPGAIMSVDFMNGGTEKTRNIDVYMISTTASTISSFVPVTASDLVFSGTVTFTPNTWTSLVFDTPFIFDGSSNVILVVDDNNGSYSYGLACYTFTAANQAIYDYDDNTNYNPTAASSYSGTVSSEKNYVRFLLGEPPTCMPVGNLTIDDSLTTANSITLTWSDTNAVNNYNIYIINGDNDSLVGNATEMTYTVTGLEATTAYTFGVRTNCGDEVSTMRTVSGRTDCAGGSCNIQLVLHDSYGDGWNGAAIDVIQAGESLGSYTIAEGNSANHSVNACSGAPVSFSWTAGNFPSETSFEILDGAGLIAFTCTSGSTLTSGAVFVTIDDPCPSCFPVSNLEVEISNHTADLSWVDDNAASWQIMINGDTTNAINATTNNYTLTGLTAETEYTVSVRANCGEGDMSAWRNISFTTLEDCALPFNLHAMDVTSSTATLAWSGASDSYTVRYRIAPPVNGVVEDFENSSLNGWTNIDADGDGYDWVLASAAPGVYHNTSADLTGTGHNSSLDYICSGSYSNYTGEALTPDNYLVSPLITLGGSITFWASAQDINYPAEHLGVAVSTTGNTSAADFTTIQEWTMTATGATPGAKEQGTWVELTADLSAYAGQTGYVAIRHFGCTDEFILNIDDITINVPDTTTTEEPWTVVTTTTNSLPVSGLLSSTLYEFQVHASCSDDDVWSNVATFMTDSSACVIYGDTTTATADNSYTWNGGVYTQSGTYYVVLPSVGGCDSILTLILTINSITPTYTVIVSSADSTMGTATATHTGSVAENTVVTATATNYTGYHFVNWTDGNGNFINATNPYTFTVTGNVTLIAHFEANDPGVTYYTVTVSSANTSMGTVTATHTGSVAENTEVTVTATALEGYRFVSWTDANGNVINGTNPYTFTVTGDVTLIANFEQGVGIEDAEMSNVSIFSANSTIYVKGAEGQNIYIYDLNGRTVAAKVNATETMEIPMVQTGVYLVRVGNASAKRVIVMR